MNKVTVLRQPADGVRGKQGPILRGPMDWESCASGFSFQAGGENDTYLDCVIYNGNYYMCKTTHTKGSAFVANQWQTAAQIPFVATMLMLAQNAKINFLSGQAIRVGTQGRTCGYFGVPDQNGEIIYTGRRDESDTSEYGPSQSTFALYSDGKARWGIPGGQRIEINPQSKELTAYDSDGVKRTTVSGGRLEPSQAIPGGNSVTTFSGTSLTATESSVTTVITTHTAASNGRVEINVPSIMLRAKANNYTAKPSVGVNHEAIPYTSVSVTIELKVGGVTVDRITYSCSSCLGMRDPSESIVDSPVNTVHKAATTLSGTVNAGQSVTVTATTSVQCTGGNGIGGFGDASTTSDAFSGRFVYGQLQCFYGSNGFSLSTDSDNYVFFLFDTSGKLHARCVSEGTILFKTANES